MEQFRFKLQTVPRISFEVWDNETHLGEVWLLTIGNTAQFGYSLPEHYRGYNLATNNVKLLCWCAFNKTQVERIVSHAHPSNVASLRVMEKVGLVPYNPPEIESYGLPGFLHFVLTKEMFLAKNENLEHLTNDLLGSFLRALTPPTSGPGL